MTDAWLRGVLPPLFILLWVCGIPAQQGDAPSDPPPLKLKVADLPKDANQRQKALIEAWPPIAQRIQAMTKAFHEHEQLEPAEYEELDEISALVRAGSLLDDQGQYYVEGLANGFMPGGKNKSSFEDVHARLKAWRTALPKSPAASSLLARLYVLWAWKARGDGFANTVDQKQAELFADRLRDARFYASEAEKLVRDDPSIYYQLVKVAQGIGEEPERIYELLKKSHDAGSYYLQTDEAAAEYFLPRWHGRPGDVERLAAWSQNELGADGGDEAYARIALMVNYYDPQTLFAGRYDNASLSKGAQALLKAYPAGKRFSNFAALASLAALDRDTAQAAARAIGRNFDLRVWHDRQLIERFKSWAAASPPSIAPKKQVWLDVKPAEPLEVQGAGAGLLFNSASASHLLMSMKPDAGRPLPVLVGPTEGCTQFCVSADRKVVLAIDTGLGRTGPPAAIAIYEGLETPAVRMAKDLPPTLHTAKLFDSGKRFVVLSSKAAPGVWNVATGEREHVLEDLALAKPGPRLDRVLSSDSSNRLVFLEHPPTADVPKRSHLVYDGAAGKRLAVIDHADLFRNCPVSHPQFVQLKSDSEAIVLGRDREKFSSQRIGTLRLEDQSFAEWPLPDFPGNLPEISPDERWLVSATPIQTNKPMELVLIDLKTRELAGKVADVPSTNQFGFTGDSKTLYAIADGLLLTWDIEQLAQGKSTKALPE